MRIPTEAAKGVQLAQYMLEHVTKYSMYEMRLIVIIARQVLFNMVVSLIVL